MTTTTPRVKTFLAEWVATNSDTWRASTKRSYQAAIDLSLVPRFGTLRLEQLTPQLSGVG